MLRQTEARGSKEKMEKKRGNVKRRPTLKLRRFRDKSDGAHAWMSKEESELARQAAASGVIAESGRMLGRREDKMAVFEQDDFELDQFAETCMTNLTEKGIGTLKSDLASLQDRCEEEAQQEILGSYSVFVNACEGVAQVDSKFQQLRTLIASTSSLTNELKRVIQPGNARLTEVPDTHSLSLLADFYAETNNIFESVIEELDVAIAERDFPIASKLLAESDKERQLDTRDGGGNSDVEIEERRHKIVNLIENQIQDPTLGAQDKHGFLQALGSVAGEVHAINFFLNLRSTEIKHNCLQHAKPHRSGISEQEGADYCGCIAQSTFHGIGLAVEDFRFVFNPQSSPHLCPLLAQWAEIETKKCAELMKTNALSAFEAAGSGLAAVIDSVSIAFVFAQALNNAHSIALMSVLRRELWPIIEGIISSFFVASADEISLSVHEEMSVFWTTSSPWDRNSSASSPSGLPLDSAQLLIDKLRYLCNTLRPLWSPVLRASIRTGIKALLESLIEALANDVKESSADGIESRVIDQMCEWLMNSLANLVEEIIPKELSSLERKIGIVFLKTDLEGFINNAATALGLEQVKENS